MGRRRPVSGSTSELTVHTNSEWVAGEDQTPLAAESQPAGPSTDDPQHRPSHPHPYAPSHPRALLSDPDQTPLLIASSAQCPDHPDRPSAGQIWSRREAGMANVHSEPGTEAVPPHSPTTPTDRPPAKIGGVSHFVPASIVPPLVVNQKATHPMPVPRCHPAGVLSRPSESKRGKPRALRPTPVMR